MPSALAIANVRPSGEYFTSHTQFECDIRMLSGLPVATSHRHTVPSLTDAASVRSSGENETDETVSEWAESVARSVPVATSHSRTLEPAPPVARVRPSCEKRMHSTLFFSGLFNWMRTRPDLHVPQLTDAVAQPIARRRPSGENARSRTGPVTRVERRQPAASGRLPHDHCPVLTPAGQSLPVGRKHQGVHLSRVPRSG